MRPGVKIHVYMSCSRHFHQVSIFYSRRLCPPPKKKITFQVLCSLDDGTEGPITNLIWSLECIVEEEKRKGTWLRINYRMLPTRLESPDSSAPAWTTCRTWTEQDGACIRMRCRQHRVCISSRFVCQSSMCTQFPRTFGWFLSLAREFDRKGAGWFCSSLNPTVCLNLPADGLRVCQIFLGVHNMHSCFFKSPKHMNLKEVTFSLEFGAFSVNLKYFSVWILFVISSFFNIIFDLFPCFDKNIYQFGSLRFLNDRRGLNHLLKNCVIVSFVCF